MEGFFSFRIVACGVSVAKEFVFVGHEAFQTYWAAGVEFACGNAYFRTETVAESVGKSGGGISVDSGGIDEGHESLCRCIVFRKYAVRVVGAVTVDVTDGFFCAADEFYGENQVGIFFVEIIIGNDFDRYNPGDLDRKSVV